MMGSMVTNRCLRSVGSNRGHLKSCYLVVLLIMTGVQVTSAFAQEVKLIYYPQAVAGSIPDGFMSSAGGLGFARFEMDTEAGRLHVISSGAYGIPGFEISFRNRASAQNVLTQIPPQLSRERIRTACGRGSLNVASARILAAVNEEETVRTVTRELHRVGSAGETKTTDVAVRLDEDQKSTDALIEHAWIYDCANHTLIRSVLITVSLQRDVDGSVREYVFTYQRDIEVITKDDPAHPFFGQPLPG